MMIPFAEWKPDTPDLGADATNAQNVIPIADGYRPFPSLSPYTNALNARCQGAFLAKDASGNAFNFAGDAKDLYQLTGQAFNAVSKAASPYNTLADDHWEFQQWGNKVIATNYADPVQVLTLGGSSFADLAGSPPKAKHIGIVRDFVVLANTYDADGSVPFRVRWSGVNNETQWTSNPQTMSDFQDLVGTGGDCQAIVGGEVGYIFQEKSIWRMTFVGSPAVFRFDEVEREIGAFAPGSVVTKGTKKFFLSFDGFYLKDGDMPAVPISEGKVSKWFFADLDQNYASRITATVDPINSVVLWAYPGAGNTGGVPNKILIYNWAVGKWAYAAMDTEYLLRSASAGYTMEQLDNFASSLDTLNMSLDAHFWTGGIINLSAFSSGHALGNLNGAPLTATIETAEVQLVPGQRANVNSVRPLVQGGTASAQVGTKVQQSDDVTWGYASAQDSGGKCPVRAEGRYHRFRVTLANGFTYAMGVDVDAAARGRR